MDGKAARAKINEARRNGSTFRCPCCRNELIIAYSPTIEDSRGRAVADALREGELLFATIEEMEEWMREERVDVVERQLP